MVTLTKDFTAEKEGKNQVYFIHSIIKGISMITMYRASTIGMTIEPYFCKLFTEKTVTTESGQRENRGGSWYYICETEKAAIEWLKSIYENRVKSAEWTLEKEKESLAKFTEKYGESA